MKNSWWWTEELSETCRVSFQNKFEKLVHLVGFIIRNLSQCTVTWTSKSGRLYIPLRCPSSLLRAWRLRKYSMPTKASTSASTVPPIRRRNHVSRTTLLPSPPSLGWALGINSTLAYDWLKRHQPLHSIIWPRSTLHSVFFTTNIDQAGLLF